jgi:hypothetical protein
MWMKGSIAGLIGMREFMWSGKISNVRAGKKIYLDIRDLDEFIQNH